MLRKKAGCPAHDNAGRRNSARHEVFRGEGHLSIIISTRRAWREKFFSKEKVGEGWRSRGWMRREGGLAPQRQRREEEACQACCRGEGRLCGRIVISRRRA